MLKLLQSQKNNPKNDQSKGKHIEDKKAEEEKRLSNFLKNISNRRNQNRRSETNVERPIHCVPVPTSQRKFATPQNEYNVPVLSRRLNYLKLKEPTLEEKEEEIKLCLSKSESPFIWKPRQGKPVDEPRIAIIRLQKKDKEIRDVNTFKWRNFILQLVISYELFKEKEISQALEKLEDLKKNLAMKANSTSEGWLFISIENALWHVITASKAFLLLENNLIDEAYKLISEIQPVHTMKRASQAGIHGIRAAVFMEYGHRGNVKGLGEAMKAVEIDRTNGEWHFLLGKCMGRIRRVSKCYELVDPLEVKAFNTAVNLDKINAHYKVYLAQTIRERAFREFKIKKPKMGTELHKKIQKSFYASYHMYIKAREEQPNCPHLLTRCAFGMMKFPFHMVDLKFIRESIDKASDLAPENPMTHHVKAMYHERFLVDAEIPLEAYEKAAALGNFGAAMDLVRMHYKLKHTNIEEELEIIAEHFEEPCQRQVAYMQAGSYNLFIKKDLVGAVKFYKKVIDIDPESYAMEFHKPLFFPLKKPVNMFDVILEELKKNTDMESFSLEEKKVLRSFMIINRVRLNNPAEQEILDVQKVIEMSRCYSSGIVKRSRKRQKMMMKPRKAKKWRGKKQKGGKEKEENVNKKESQNKSKSGLPLDETGWQSNGRRDSAKRSYGQQQHLSSRERTNSVSSVDSDYCRDNRNRGQKDLFSEHCNKNDQDACASSSAAKHSPSRSRMSSPSSSYSRDLSVCSISSTESAMSVVGHHSRYFQEVSAQKNSKDEEENKLGLTVENLKRFDSNHTDDLGRRLSVMSISSAGSENKLGVVGQNLDGFDSKYTNDLGRRMRQMSISSAESDQSSKSRTERIMMKVKQSYGMLGYKNNDESICKNSQKNGSTQSLNQQIANKKGVSNRKQPFQRSESTQSLNIQHTNFKPPIQEGYKPAFGSRELSGGSTRSSLFMPTFSKKSETDSENL
uniref:Uncharacterized protein n=1 Tax=Graphocephala atropunctata TaxID=36148 RepID=A0A1B6MKH9_9HEMI